MKHQVALWRVAMFCLLALAGLAGMAKAAGGEAPEAAGTVSFVIGEANAAAAPAVEGGAPVLHPLQRGDAIAVGETLLTGANGHIHLKMSDGAFVSVRPQSRFRIEQYHYDPATPANNRIKFVLEEGTARSITGRAGEAAHQNYRLNTPLAAIGIRGTDFVVQALPDVTRVTVQSGAVSFSPLGGDCAASGSGPCASLATRVLTAAMRNGYLELNARATTPVLVPAERAINNPNTLSPARPEEPKGADNKTVGSADSKEALLSQAADSVLRTATHVETGTVTTPPPVAVVAPVTQFYWGRWADTASIVAAIGTDHETTIGNGVFGLFRDKGSVNMPGSGVAKFQLAASEAYAMSGGKVLGTATVSSPSLTIDFGARTYATALTVNSAATGNVSITSSGDILRQGQFNATTNSANTIVNGTLSNDASQAAYLFDRTGLVNGTSVTGATRWFR